MKRKETLKKGLVEALIRATEGLNKDNTFHLLKSLNLSFAMKNKKQCSVGNCDKKFYAKGYCALHYGRLLRNGNVHSRHGSVFTSDIDRFWSRVNLTANPEKCWEWSGALTSTGYGNAYFNKKQTAAHRLAWFLTYGKFPELFLLHLCDNPKCVNPKHLQEGTQLDNMRDKVSKQRQAKGETNGNSVLTADKVLQIKQMLSANIPSVIIAKTFKVTPENISSIKRGKTWSWLQKQDYINQRPKVKRFVPEQQSLFAI